MDDQFARFDALRRTQSTMNDRPLYTRMDDAAARVVYDVAVSAMQAVRDGNTDVTLRAASLSTGTGKSTSAWAFVAMMAQSDPEFTCAYACPTVKLAEEAQQGIEALLGHGTTTLWSTYHKHKGRDEVDTMRKHGSVPTRLVDRTLLRYQRIVVITHATLAGEVKADEQSGIRDFKGTPRSLVFIDESPEVLETVTVRPVAVAQFHALVTKVNPAHEWLPMLSEAWNRMNAVVEADGQTYEAVELVTPADGRLLDCATRSYLSNLADDGSSLLLARHQRTDLLEEVVTFLRAASRGCVFYNRNDRSFSGYRLDFDRTYPGYVLLDATADLAGFVTLNPQVRSVDVPEVDYSPLDIVHVRHPKEFYRVSDVTKRADTGSEYGQWIRDTVIANSAPGDDILVVTHKEVLNLNFIEGSEDPAKPADWEGRKVNTIHYGSGVGLNTWKLKTSVMMFGEFFPPRSKTISTYHGWSTEPLTSETLKHAEGKRVAGDDYAPQGPYHGLFDGHLLRWTKQLACRGSVRNIDAEGKCGPMKLLLTMSLNRLSTGLRAMFPGAKMPPAGKQAVDRKGASGVTNGTTARKGRAALVDLLQAGSKSLYPADEVERITGVRTHHLRRDFDVPAVASVARAYGWTLKAAKDLGMAGRTVYLVHPERHLQAA